MTTRSATYAKSAAGRLEVVFSATFGSSTTSDAGFPGQNGNSDVVIQCRVLDGSGTQIGITYIRSAVPSAHLLLNYPGGGASWTVEMSDVAHNIGGLGSVWAAYPKAIFILIKA